MQQQQQQQQQQPPPPPTIAPAAAASHKQPLHSTREPTSTHTTRTHKHSLTQAPTSTNNVTNPCVYAIVAIVVATDFRAKLVQLHVLSALSPLLLFRTCNQIPPHSVFVSLWIPREHRMAQNSAMEREAAEPTSTRTHKHEVQGPKLATHGPRTHWNILNPIPVAPSN